MTHIDRLTEVFQKRWTAPILQLLWQHKGAKYITLVKTLGASPGAVRSTLRDLIKREWVMKNPGYGHPMRPEYILTSKGADVANRCNSLLHGLENAGLEEMHRSKWAVTVLHCLSEGPLRFSELKAAIPAVTDRSLVLCLKVLCKSGAVVRKVEDTFPPSVSYSLSHDAMALTRHISSLASALRLGP